MSSQEVMDIWIDKQLKMEAIACISILQQKIKKQVSSDNKYLKVCFEVYEQLEAQANKLRDELKSGKTT